MQEKAEVIALFSIILGVILFFLPNEYFPYSLFFLCSGIGLAVIKSIWNNAGWIVDNINKL